MTDIYNDEELFSYVISPEIRKYNRARFALNIKMDGHNLFKVYLGSIYKMDGPEELADIINVMREIVRDHNYASKNRIYIYSGAGYAKIIMKKILG